MPTELQAETRQGIAREIAKRYTREGTGYADRLYQLAYAIEAALNNRDERAARIAESEYADPNWHQYYRTASMVIARAIRNEDHK